MINVEVLSMTIIMDQVLYSSISRKLGFIILGVALIYLGKGFWLTLREMRGDNTDE